MQSRLAPGAAKFNRMLLSGTGKQFLGRRLASGTSTGRTADPAVHAVEPEEVYPTDAILDEKLRRLKSDHETTSKDNDPYVPPKSPLESTPKLESPGVGPRTDPIVQQKRRNSTVSAKIDDVSCAGLDGSPWPADDAETDRREQREQQEDDDREYFKHHRASPLSEIEVVDTRKPITKATDGTATNAIVGYDGIVDKDRIWRPEQLDTAEDSLRRAVEIFRMNAMRGDPDSPHGRVLRQLRGEYW